MLELTGSTSGGSLNTASIMYIWPSSRAKQGERNFRAGMSLFDPHMNSAVDVDIRKSAPLHSNFALEVVQRSRTNTTPCGKLACYRGTANTIRNNCSSTTTPEDRRILLEER